MRYTPNSDTVVKEMLSSMGLSSLDELFDDIPNEIKETCLLPESGGLTELSVRRELEQLAFDNTSTEDCPLFLGAGCYDHYIPAAVPHLLQRSEFYTAYTPYQPEISQGILQAIFEYQTYICNLTGMDVSNASLYCGGSALAEACHIAADTTKRKKILLPATLHPDYAKIARTNSMSGMFEPVTIPESNGTIDLSALESLLDDSIGGVVIQYPNFFGNLEEVAEIIALARKTKGLVIMVVDPIALSMLKSPGEWGADIAVGDAQVLGNPMSFGGPHIGFIAVKQGLVRKIPGRLVGQTTDSQGRCTYVLTLQAREQHIRREKATSNVCSNQALNALTASMYLSFVGPLGLKQAAITSHRLARYAHDKMEKAGFRFLHSAPFFREFALAVNDPNGLNRYLYRNGIIGGYPLEGGMLLSFTEKRQREEINELVDCMTEFFDNPPDGMDAVPNDYQFAAGMNQLKETNEQGELA